MSQSAADQQLNTNADRKEADMLDVERTAVTPPLSPSSPEGKPPTSYSLSRWWLNEVDTTHGDLLLLSCCFVQGLLDCTSFKNWGAFIGMQTGNTVILCLSTAKYPQGQPWAFGTTLISIISFFLGCFFATRVSALFQPTRRIVFTANILLQCLLITLAAGLTTGTIMLTDEKDDAQALFTNARIMIGIAPLAIQSGMTIATSRIIGLGNEIPVVVYTSTYAALAGDPNLFKLWPPSANKPRNRRIVAVICVFGGALVATWLEARSIGMIAVLWMSAGIKLVLALMVAIVIPRQEERKSSTPKA